MQSPAVLWKRVGVRKKHNNFSARLSTYSKNLHLSASVQNVSQASATTEPQGHTQTATAPFKVCVSFLFSFVFPARLLSGDYRPESPVLKERVILLLSINIRYQTLAQKKNADLVHLYF